MTSLVLQGRRGTAVPETAMVMAIFLMALYSLIEYGVLGYEQVSADGATFIGAHDTVAQYGGPTNANNSYTQKVVNSIFDGLRVAHVSSIASNSSYETDVTMASGGGGFESMLPTSLSTTSREVEASSSAGNTNTPLGNCTTAAVGLANGLVADANPTVDLLQGTIGSSSGLFTLSAGATSGNVVNLQTGTITNSLGLLHGIVTQLQSTTATLSQLSAVLSATGSISVGGATITTAVSAAIQPPLAQALNGTLTQTTLNAAGNTLSAELGPLGPLLATAVDPLLYGTNSLGVAFTGVGVSGSANATVPGLLSGGSNGGLLMGLNNAVAAVNALDPNAPKACP